MAAGGTEPERKPRDRHLIIKRRTGWWITLADDVGIYVAGEGASLEAVIPKNNTLKSY